MNESGPEQSVKPLTHLLVRWRFAALQSGFAKLDGFNEAAFFGEIAAEKLASKFLRALAFLGSDLRKLCFLLRCEMDLHAFRLRTGRGSVNPFSPLTGLLSWRFGWRGIGTCEKMQIAILRESALKNLSFRALILDDHDVWIHFGSPEKLPKSISSQLPDGKFAHF